MDERAAFERNIDENPLDATNHLVYADWLDEHGEPDEAAFRRAMGQWVGNTPGVGVRPNTFNQHDWWAGGKLGYPEGVALERMPFPRQPGYPQSPHISAYPEPRPAHYPAAHANRDLGDDPSHYGHIGFRNYRGMEEAFRRAFMAGRRRPEPPPDNDATKLSRRRLVQRYRRK